MYIQSICKVFVELKFSKSDCLTNCGREQFPQFPRVTFLIVDQTKPKESETSREKERKQKSRSSRSKEEVKKRESSREIRHGEDVVRDKRKHRDEKDNRHTDGKHKSESRDGSGTMTGSSRRSHDVEDSIKMHEKIRDKDRKKRSSSKERGKSSIDNDKKRDAKHSERKHNDKREKDTRERRKEAKDLDDRKHRKDRDKSSKKEKVDFFNWLTFHSAFIGSLFLSILNIDVQASKNCVVVSF